MRNRLKAILVGLTAFLTACSIAITLPSKPFQASSAITPEKASFKIYCEDDKGILLGAASGVIIGPGRALTAAHVTGVCGQFRGHLVMAGTKWRLYTLKEGEADMDLSLLGFGEKDQISGGVKRALENPKVGSPLIVYAYPGFMDDLILTRGIVSGYYQINDSILTDAPITFGDSGGGVFNEQGELIGIVSAITRPENAPHYAIGILVPIEKVNKFILGY